MAYDLNFLAQSGNPYAMTQGIIPTPGTPAYETMLSNVMSAKPQAGLSSGSLSGLQRNATDAYNTLSNRGINFGIMPTALSGAAGGGAGGAGGSTSGGSSSMSSGAGLLEEILGLIRGTGDKQMQTARRRLTEDYGTAREQKMSDLARRGLFRAGIGEKEMQAEVDKPFTRGQSDLASNLYDAQVDTSLRKASILGDIEAQARKAQAEKYAQSAQTGTGAYTMNPSAGTGGRGGGASGGGDAGGGGVFGAQFVDARKQQASAPGSGGYISQMGGGQMSNWASSGGIQGPSTQGGSVASPGMNVFGGGGGEAGGGIAVPQLGIAGGKYVTAAQSGGTSGGYRLPSGAFVYGARQ